VSVEGKNKSRAVGCQLRLLAPAGTGAFEFIVSSPELRCAQTACEIAQVLDLPVLFDENLCDRREFRCGRPVHRNFEELVEALRTEYPDVQCASAQERRSQIGGCPPRFGKHPLDDMSRFCCTAVSQLKSVIIVSHSDAVATIASIMDSSLCASRVPQSGFLIGTRALQAETTTGHTTGSWGVTLSTGIQCKAVTDKRRHKLARISEDSVFDVGARGFVRFSTEVIVASPKRTPIFDSWNKFLGLVGRSGNL